MLLPRLLISSYVILLTGCSVIPERQPLRPELLLTFDDFPCLKESAPQIQREINQKILDVLRKHETHAMVFVNSSMIETNKQAEREEILRLWIRDGHQVGNHTFSHHSLSKTPIFDYKEDITKGEPILTRLLGEFKQKLKYFRYPYLDYGKEDKKKEIKSFLTSRGYEIVHVSINSMDYKFNSSMYKGDDDAEEDFIDYVTDILEEKAEEPPIFGGRHIMLFHVSRITANCLDEIATIAEDLGYDLSK